MVIDFGDGADIAADAIGALNERPKRKRAKASRVKPADKAAPRKKRRKGTSPTARTLAECRKRGWIAGVVERHIPFPRPQGTKIDLFGVIDLVVIVPPEPAPEYEDDWERDGRLTGNQGSILAIQATASSAHHAHRRTKILAEPRARAWVEAGGRLELWSWAKRGARGKVKRWTLRVEAFTVESWRTAPATDLPADLVPDAIAVHRQRRPRIGAP